MRKKLLPILSIVFLSFYCHSQCGQFILNTNASAIYRDVNTDSGFYVLGSFNQVNLFNNSYTLDSGNISNAFLLKGHHIKPFNIAAPVSDVDPSSSFFLGIDSRIYDTAGHVWGHQGDTSALSSQNLTATSRFIRVSPTKYLMGGRMANYDTTPVNFCFIYDYVTDSITPLNLPGALIDWTKAGNKVYMTYDPYVIDNVHLKVFDLDSMAWQSNLLIPPANFILANIVSKGDTVFVCGVDPTSNTYFHLWRYIPTSGWTDIFRASQGAQLLFTGMNVIDSLLYMTDGINQTNNLGFNMKGDVSYDINHGTLSSICRTSLSSTKALGVNNGYLISGEVDGSIYTSEPTGIREIQNENLIIYPNPSSQYIIIDGTLNEPIEISDVCGHVLIKQPKNENKVDVQSLASGLYFVNQKYKFIKE